MEDMASRVEKMMKPMTEQELGRLGGNVDGNYFSDH